jgi:ABC-2 type transport system ATP-binding protein
MSIEVKDLSFRYGKVVALDGVSARLGEGAVGLLGPNGAGKSTLIRILLGFLVPERGEGKVLDFDIRRDRAMIRRSVGYMPESDCFVAGMDAVTFTSYFGELSGMPRQEAMKRAHEVLFYVGLGEARYRLLDTYSAGMKQRLKLAQALVHDPKVVILDEPTVGLDPAQIVEIRSLIKSLRGEHTVILSTHILAEVTQTCDGVVIINEGRLMASGSLEELTASVRRSEGTIVRVRRNTAAAAEALRAVPGVDAVAPAEDGLRVEWKPGDDPREAIARLCLDGGFGLLEMRTPSFNIEDLYLRIVSGGGEQ